MTPEFYSLQVAPAKLAADNDNTFSRFGVFSLTRSLLQQALRNANAGKLDLLQIEFARVFIGYIMYYLVKNSIDKCHSYLFLDFNFAVCSKSLKVVYLKENSFVPPV